MEDSKVVIHDVPPYMRVYNDGTIERLLGTEIAPPTLEDHETKVSSKDILILPEIGVSARIYRPKLHNHDSKLPLVVYFHGGAFLISSTADPKYHQMLNLLVKEANIILVSIDYRRAPEHPLPTAYDDSWAALEWIDEKSNDIWISENADFEKVYLAGDSAGANISHHMAMKLASGVLKLKIKGILMVHPYFWGKEAMGVEAENPMFKGVVDKWWEFVCKSEEGCDDPLINPFANGDPGLEGLKCERVLVCVAGNDILRERGRFYYESLVKSKWEGEVEVFETQGEDHVFHIIDSTSHNAFKLIKHCANFINHQ